MTSGLGYRRADLQAMAESKLADAILLAENGRYSNAYYLAGYTVELALKACISRQIVAETIPDPDWVHQIYVHKFAKLAGLAGLGDALQEKQASDAQFGRNWLTVSEWTESSRYEMFDQTSCQDLIEAITNDPSGVLTWLKQHW